MQARCGQHALNNLVGGPQFTVQDLQMACDGVCAETVQVASAHVRLNGWYSHSVLANVLQMLYPLAGGCY